MFFSNPQYFLPMLNLGFVPSLSTQDNATAFLKTMNDFITYLYNNNLLSPVSKIVMTSGWRSEAHNKAIGGAPNSLHILGRAIDLATTEVALVCEKNPQLLEFFNLYLESSLDTAANGGHTHLQNLAPHSGARIYRA